jgi:hypothetical protein
MSGNLRLGGAIVDGVRLEAFRHLDADYPYELTIDDIPWRLTVAEARKLALAATFHPIKPGQHRTPGPRYRGHAGGEDGKIIIIELGVQPGDDGDIWTFAFGDVKATGRIGGGGALEGLFERLAADVTCIRRSGRLSGPQQLFVNSRTYRSPYGWDGGR